MDDTKKIEIIKSITGESDLAIIGSYLEISKGVILNHRYPFGYTDFEEVPQQYNTLHIEMTVYLMNKKGVEGQIGQNEGGVNRSYESGGVPLSMLNRIIPMAQPIGGGVVEATGNQPETV